MIMLEVDYNTPTRLYEAIQNSDWKSASRAIRLYPEEASTWVVRHGESEIDGIAEREGIKVEGILWRFLPLHSALARNPPARFIHALIHAYPEGVGLKDVSGMLPLHYACGNRVSKEIIQMLLEESEDGTNCGYARGVWEEDGNGMTPLHYVASWGQSEMGIVQMMLGAADESGEHRGARDLILKQDHGGHSPLDLARVGEYEGKEDIVAEFEQCLSGDNGEKYTNDSRIGLQVVTAPSPRNRTPKARDSPRSRSRSKSRHSPAEIIPTADSKEKHFHHLSPRTSSSEECLIHMMDSRSPVETTMRLASSQDSSGRRERFRISTRSLESPRKSTTHATTPTISNIKSIRTPTFESPTMTNMKTPRSSGRGSFFDHPPPSPRYPSNAGLTSPRKQFLSPHASTSVTSQYSQDSNSGVMAELQRLKFENETLMHQSHARDVENAELRAKLAEYEKGSAYNQIAVQQQVEQTVVRLQSLLQALALREQSLVEIVSVASQREDARLQSSSTRRQELLKLLAAEENEMERENGYLFQGSTLGVAFGKEIEALQEVRGEVVRMLEGFRMG
jgi:hypothetical protein